MLVFDIGLLTIVPGPIVVVLLAFAVGPRNPFVVEELTSAVFGFLLLAVVGAGIAFARIRAVLAPAHSTRNQRSVLDRSTWEQSEQVLTSLL